MRTERTAELPGRNRSCSAYSPVAYLAGPLPNSTKNKTFDWGSQAGGRAILASQQGRHSAADEVGLGLLAAGVVSKIFSAVTTPAADTRAWDNLPQYLSFASMRLPEGAHSVTVEFLDAGGSPLANLTRTVAINVSDPARDTVIFVSDKNQ